jgi:hypothetical protein
MNTHATQENTTGTTLANGGLVPTTTNPNAPAEAANNELVRTILAEFDRRTPAPQLIAFSVWTKQLGRSRSTGWRWRKDGTIREQDLRRLYGKLYITLEGVRYFDDLIKSGRLAGELHGVAAKSKTPPRSVQLRDMARDNGEDAAEIAADEQFKCGHAATEGAQ